MKNVRFVSRADDAGSSISANIAMQGVIKGGFIKNISIMAPGAYVDDLYSRIGNEKRVCFGLHSTINAEWDKVKWKPVSSLPADCGLLDGNGYFLSDPKLFAETKPDPAVIVSEISAQLDKLTKIGFDIKYIDSHMLPEYAVPGLNEAMEDFIKSKGLIDHMYFYNLPEGYKEVASGQTKMLSFLRQIPTGQYFFVIHPAAKSDEMLQTGNAAVSGEDICNGRDSEYRMFSSKLTVFMLRAMGITSLRYDEAKPGRRITMEEVSAIFGG